MGHRYRGRDRLLPGRVPFGHGTVHDVADDARDGLSGGSVGRDLNGLPRNRDVAVLVGSVVGVGSLVLAVFNAVQGQWLNLVAT